MPLQTWSVAIFSSRESIGALSSSLEAAIAATKDVPAVVDVVINGNRPLADEVGSFIERLQGSVSAAKLVRTWLISVSDKAHAWNAYLYKIWPNCDLAHFVDGYVRVMPDAFSRIAESLEASPKALAASGIPTMGKSANTLRTEMLRYGGMHGNLYSVRGAVLRKLRERGFRLPLGIYYNDGLLGAVLYFGLDPANNAWDKERVVVHPQANWTFTPLSWWRVSDLRSHARRMIRKAQGTLETLAVREYLAVQRKLPQDLPRTVSDLVLGWTDAFPWAARSVFIRSPLCFCAARRLRASRDWAWTAEPPLLIAERDLAQTPVLE